MLSVRALLLLRDRWRGPGAHAHSAERHLPDRMVCIRVNPSPRCNVNGKSTARPSALQPWNVLHLAYQVRSQYTMRCLEFLSSMAAIKCCRVFRGQVATQPPGALIYRKSCYWWRGRACERTCLSLPVSPLERLAPSRPPPERAWGAYMLGISHSCLNSCSHADSLSNAAC